MLRHSYLFLLTSYKYAYRHNTYRRTVHIAEAIKFIDVYESLVSFLNQLAEDLFPCLENYLATAPSKHEWRPEIDISMFFLFWAFDLLTFGVSLTSFRTEI